MDIYKLLKLNRMIRSNRLKLLLIFFAHMLNKRYYSVRIDPVFACNLRCRMCYFSKSRKSMPGKFTREELELIGKNIFVNALQVVVGCGAEPTLHSDFIYLVELAKKFGVPHVGLVTNGQLISSEDLEKLSRVGLNELILSIHGLEKETYETFMVGASWEKLIQLLEAARQLNSKTKLSFSIRFNVTVNPENVDELERFFDVFSAYPISTLQVRPVMDIGGEYTASFNSDTLYRYNRVIEKLKIQSKKSGVMLLANTQNPQYLKIKPNPLITETYKYISPQYVIEHDYDWRKESYRQFLGHNGWHKSVLRKIFLPWSVSEISDYAERHSGQYDIL